MPITDNESQHMHKVLIILGTLSATSGEKYPFSPAS